MNKENIIIDIEDFSVLKNHTSFDLQEKEQLESLLKISSSLHTTQSYTDIGKIIVEELKKFKLGEIVGVKLAVYDDEEDKYTIVYQTEYTSRDEFEKFGVPTGLPISLKEVKYYSKKALDERKTLIIQDNHSELSLSIAPVQKTVQPHSMIFIPLICKGKIVGLLSFARSPERSLFLELVDFLQSVGNLISVVIGEMLNEKRRLKIEKEIIDSEMRYKTLIEISPDGIGLLDLQGTVLFCNQQGAMIFGFSNAAEGIGRNVFDYIHPEDKERALKQLQNVITTGELKNVEFNMLKKDGSTFPSELSIKAIYDSDKKPKSFLVFIRDLTNKKFIESQFLRSQRMESIGTLASGIAHDLNNVMSPILMSMEILHERYTDEQSVKLFETIEKSAHRGTDLIRQLLSFAKGNPGEKTEIQITHLINETLKIIKETFPKNIVVKKNIGKNIMTISGDPTYLHQVLMNLCVNARDAMPEGGVLQINCDNIYIDELHAKKNIDARIGNYVLLEVQDSGIGMTMEIQSKVFDPFFTTKQDKGTGLGLATVYSIVKGLGGFINLYSEVKKGTSFKIYFPALETSTAMAKPELKIEISRGNGELILVVDDEAIFLDLSKAILENNGYKVITAKNGAEAVTLYAQKKDEIKVILLDQIMPVMDGPSTMKVLRSMNPEVKIIAMSGFSTDNIVASPGSVQGFLQKPFHIDKLLLAVHGVLTY